MKNSHSALAASFAALSALAMQVPQTAHAQCNSTLFADKVADPNFFWSDAHCSVSDAMEEQQAAVLKDITWDYAKSIATVVLAAAAGGGGEGGGEGGGGGEVGGGLIDMFFSTLKMMIDNPLESDAFSPGIIAVLQAVQNGTNQVISKVNENFSKDDFAELNSIEGGYLTYASHPLDGRLVFAPPEMSQTNAWFDTMAKLSLDRHGPIALHTALSLADVYVRRMMDLELVAQLLLHKPGTMSEADYVASLSPADRDSMAKTAGQQAMIDAKIMFNGGFAKGSSGGGRQVNGFFNDVARFANGGFRSYSDSRFSDITLKGTHQDFCGSNFGKISKMETDYHFPLDRNDPGSNPGVPQYHLTISWDSPCDKIDPHQIDVRWTMEVTNSSGKQIFSTHYDVPVDAKTHELDSDFVTAEPVRILKQAAYDRFLSMSYGAARPALDMWWKAVGNPGYSAYKADAEINSLVMNSTSVREAADQLAAFAGDDWSEDTATTRVLVNYALSYGAADLYELAFAPQADRVSREFKAADYRRFLARLSPPADARKYYEGQMAAKIIAIVR